MLPLGRHLATTYFSPLASRISSMLSTRDNSTSILGSKSKDLTSATDTTSQGIRLRNAKVDFNGRKYGSIDSERGLVPAHFQYKAGVTGGDPVERNKNIPHQSIQVEKKYDVDQSER
jgi:hypothetical protein